MGLTTAGNTLRELAARRDDADKAWRDEIRRLAVAGYSTRQIAIEAGVSHTTVWMIAKP
jgi:transposase-like protein